MSIQGGDQAKNTEVEIDGEVEQQFIVFDLDGEEYAVPINEVRGVLEIPAITPVPDSPSFILGIMNLRGKIVPVLDLEKRLSLTKHEATVSRHILVTDYENSPMGIQVDRVKEVLRTKHKYIQPSPTMISAKIAPEFLGGVIVLSKHPLSDDEEAELSDSHDEAISATSQHESRVILLLNLKKIITLEELQSLTEPSVPSERSADEAEHTQGETAE